MSSDLKAKAALVLGALLSLPVIRGVSAGTIPLASGAIRIAVAMVLAYAAIALVTAVIGGYLPKAVAAEEPPAAKSVSDGIEDAVLVDEQPPAEHNP